jgi:hypothetical protein
MENKKKLIIQIPDEIIRNSIFNLDANTFATYTYLKFLYFRNYNESTIELDTKEVKRILNLTDNRTLKKCLNNLHKNDMLVDEVKNLPKRNPLTIQFIPDMFITEKFTQLPATILYKLKDMGSIGLRLLFYYESYINRTEPIQKQFAFPGIETIAKDLHINKETVTEYNRILVKEKLIKITKHKLQPSGEFDELDRGLFTKYNHHYHVQIDKL